MSSAVSIITADWPAPANVRAFSTTRSGGMSRGVYHALNLGDHVGDDAQAVAANRAHLIEQYGLPEMPRWLQQVHGSEVADLRQYHGPQAADAGWTDQLRQVCAILTADCLPVLFCDDDGSVVAAAHAGWRGLAAGILEATLAQLPVSTARLMAWLGPAISQAAFEVGAEVRDSFIAQDPQSKDCFLAAAIPGKYQADLYELARRRLRSQGLTAIYGGEYCSYSDPQRFFSYRRDGVCGRMASLIWIE